MTSNQRGFVPVDTQRSFPDEEARYKTSGNKGRYLNDWCRNARGESRLLRWSPFATGLPHYAHPLASTIKDIANVTDARPQS